MQLPSNEILIDNNLHSVEMVSEEALGGNAGDVHGPKKRIRILDTQTASDLVDTIWHEIFHAILTCRGRGILHLKSADEEAVVSCLSGGLVQVLRDNPDWAKWLMKMGDDHCRRSSPVSSSLPNTKKEKSHGRRRETGNQGAGS